MSITNQPTQAIILLNNFYQNDLDNYKIAYELHELIIARYPFLTLQIKWNTPCYHFNEHNIFYFITKNHFETKKYTKPQLFLGFVQGFKLFHSKLFIVSKLSNVKYINLTKIKKDKYKFILEIIGNAIEV